MLLLQKRAGNFAPHKNISRTIFCALAILFGQSAFAQITATFNTTENTNCNGSGCSYTGPSILINEIMMSPSSFDGSLSGTDANQRGEWIELYNPNLCEPVDISCYYLASNVYVAGLFGIVSENSKEAFILPQGTIVPAGGFCVVRGANSVPVPSANLIQNGGNTVEIIMPELITGPGICISGTQQSPRFWFPNAGGWFGFFDRNGVPQDAVSWSNVSNTNVTIDCIPTSAGCNNSVTTLPSYDAFPADRKMYVFGPGEVTPSWGQSIRRSPDGGNWVTNAGTASFTIGGCNDACIPPSASSCTGTATVNPTGGTAPYTYAWNDSQGQLTQTAIGLCAGTYTVTVTDNLGATAQFNVDVVDFVPTVTLDLVDQVCIDLPAFPITVASPIASGSETGVFSGTGVTASDFNPQTAGAGQHDITYEFTDAQGCTNSATDQITVNPLPVLSITGIDNPYCVTAGSDVLDVSPAGGTLTGPGIIAGTTEFEPPVADVGTHTLTYNYTDGNGCSNTTTASANVIALPVVSITGIAPSYCLSNTPETFTLQPAGGTLSGPGVTNNTFVPSAAGIGTHTLTYVYSDANGCENSTTADVTVVAVPSPSIVTPDSLCIYVPAITLVGVPAGGVFTVNGTQTATFDPQAVGEGTHTIVYSYTDANNCIALANETIKVLPRPTLSTNVASHYCAGTGIVPLTLTPAGGTLTGDFISGNSIDLTGQNPGNYSITYEYTDDKGCENTITDPFILTARIYPDFGAGTDCFQNVIFINKTTPFGTYNYAWEFDGTGTSTAVNPDHHFVEHGLHNIQLTVTDSYNCVYDTIIEIDVTEGVSPNTFVIPNVITPNGDGINDFLELPALIEECLSYKILILNRWGNLVYEMNSAQNAFAGIDKGGKDLQEGVYFYLVESDVIDCKSDQYKGFCSGFITIAR